MATTQPHKQVAVLFTASLLYGLYTSTLLYTLRWLLFSDRGWSLRRPKSINWPMVLVTILIFLLTLVYLVATFASVMHVVYIASTLDANAKTKPQVGQMNWPIILQYTAANLTALLADAALMYRCFIVTNRCHLILLFRTILWFGGLACTILQVYLQIVSPSTNPLIDPSSLAHVNTTLGPGIVLTPFWGSAAVLGAYCTIVLIYKIYKAVKDSGDETSTTEFRFVIRVLAESGVLYLSVTIAHFVVWFTANDFAISIVTAFNLPLIGIAFNLIIIRTSANRSRFLTSDSDLPSNHFRDPSYNSHPYSNSRAHNNRSLSVSHLKYPKPYYHPPHTHAHSQNPSIKFCFTPHHPHGSTGSLNSIPVEPGLKLFSDELYREASAGQLGVFSGGVGGEGEARGLNMHASQGSNVSTTTGITLVER